MLVRLNFILAFVLFAINALLLPKQIATKYVILYAFWRNKSGKRGQRQQRKAAAKKCHTFTLPATPIIASAFINFSIIFRCHLLYSDKAHKTFLLSLSFRREGGFLIRFAIRRMLLSFQEMELSSVKTTRGCEMANVGMAEDWKIQQPHDNHVKCQQLKGNILETVTTILTLQKINHRKNNRPVFLDVIQDNQNERILWFHFFLAYLFLWLRLRVGCSYFVVVFHFAVATLWLYGCIAL